VSSDDLFVAWHQTINARLKELGCAIYLFPESPNGGYWREFYDGGWSVERMTDAVWAGGGERWTEDALLVQQKIREAGMSHGKGSRPLDTRPF
jgi:hypothetical protein